MLAASLPRIFFSDVFDVSSDLLAEYGAFEVPCVRSLPLFIDPFLLFASKNAVYQKAHQEIIRYLSQLRKPGGYHDEWVEARSHFPRINQCHLGDEVAQHRDWRLNANWLFRGIPQTGDLDHIHLESLALASNGINRAAIHDCATRVIQGLLLEYTQSFAVAHLDPAKLKTVQVSNVTFNYAADRWEGASFRLPWFGGDFILLTPVEILTSLDTWINWSHYLLGFNKMLTHFPPGVWRDKVERIVKDSHGDEGIDRVSRMFPELIREYIKQREGTTRGAVRANRRIMAEAKLRFVQNSRDLARLLAQHTPFYHLQDTWQRVRFLKEVVENHGGHECLHIHGRPVETESELRTIMQLIWRTASSEGIVDGPIQLDTLAQSNDNFPPAFKLAADPLLEIQLRHARSLDDQAPLQEKRFQVVVCFNSKERTALRKLQHHLSDDPMFEIVVIDARLENKFAD